MSKTILIMLLFAASTGCVSIKPWVSPYQRNNLADPIMQFSRAPVAERYMDHVYEAREGARGAEGGGGGGCGCS
jgi:Domain of unknown function (DUF4266)